MSWQTTTDPIIIIIIIGELINTRDLKVIGHAFWYIPVYAISELDKRKD